MNNNNKTFSIYLQYIYDKKKPNHFIKQSKYTMISLGDVSRNSYIIKNLFNSNMSFSNIKIKLNITFSNKSINYSYNQININDLYMKKPYIDDILNSKINISKFMLNYYLIQFSTKYNKLILNRQIADYFNYRITKEDSFINNNFKWTSDNDSNLKDLDSKFKKYFNKGISLYPSEKNLLWMYNIEKRIYKLDNTSHKKFKFIINPDYEIDSSYLPNSYSIEDVFIFPNKKPLIENNSISIENNKIYNSSRIIEAYKLPVNLTGGIISDSVGLGKTLSCISHIIASDYIYKSKELESNKEFNYQGRNLIIVPNRIVEQWYLELEKYLSPELFDKIGICKIMSLSQIKKIKKDDVEKKGIFIINANLFEMKENYLKFLEPKDNEPSDKFKFNILETKWNRIFVDEIHEICVEPVINDNSIYDIIY